jgi:hypothetical protein
MATDTVMDKIKNVGLIFLGAVIIVICLALFKSNMYVFMVFMCLYIGIYAIIVVIYLYKKVSDENQEFNILINVSLYTVCLIVCIAIFAIYLMNASTQYRYSSRY